VGSPPRTQADRTRPSPERRIATRLPTSQVPKFFGPLCATASPRSTRDAATRRHSSSCPRLSHNFRVSGPRQAAMGRRCSERPKPPPGWDGSSTTARFSDSPPTARNPCAFPGIYATASPRRSSRATPTNRVRRTPGTELGVCPTGGLPHGNFTTQGAASPYRPCTSQAGAVIGSLLTRRSHESSGSNR
jgi:hypothetical protein